jgi:hypothetical protein
MLLESICLTELLMRLWRLKFILWARGLVKVISSIEVGVIGSATSVKGDICYCHLSWERLSNYGCCSFKF